MPLGVLTLCGALLSYRLGWIDVHLSESAAIEAYAARYARAAGAGASAAGSGRSECAAQPGETVWLVVRCGSGPDSVAYFVNRFGGLVAETRPAPHRDHSRSLTKEPST